MSTQDNPWHPWQLRKNTDGIGYEILRHDGWMVWADVHAGASDDDIKAAIARAETRRTAWLETVR